MTVKNNSLAKKKSPYKFETFLNDFGDTVVYLHKGKHKVWLFNIGREGDIQLDVYPFGGIAAYKKVGLQTEDDDNGFPIPVFVGLQIHSKPIVERLNNIEDILEKVFNI